MRLVYLGVLGLALAGTALPLELLLHTQVFSRWRRLLLTLPPVVVVFTGWDLYAIARHHWRYDPRQTTGVELPGHLPLEELLFFVVIPICAILAFEAVRAVRGWPTGEE